MWRRRRGQERAQGGFETRQAARRRSIGAPALLRQFQTCCPGSGSCRWPLVSGARDQEEANRSACSAGSPQRPTSRGRFHSGLDSVPSRDLRMGIVLVSPSSGRLVVIGRPRRLLLPGGEQVAAVVRAAGDPPPTAEELTEFCRARLASFKTARRWAFVDAFPLTRSAGGSLVKAGRKVDHSRRLKKGPPESGRGAREAKPVGRSGAGAGGQSPGDVAPRSLSRSR